MAENDPKTTESVFSKTFWIISTVVIGALVMIPLTYYVIIPLTPKAVLTASISGPADNIGIEVKNESTRFSAKDVTVGFVTSSQSLDPKLHIWPSPLCKPSNMHHFEYEYLCSIVNPNQSITIGMSGALDIFQIQVYISHDGSGSQKLNFTRCRGIFVAGSAC